MRLLLKQSQLEGLITKLAKNQELMEDEPGTGAPETGTSGDGEKKTGATKWESGVTRGPANQIGVTKWSDVVGSTLKRGKANPLSEQSAPPIGTKVGNTTYKTFWGESIEIPNENFKVALWSPVISRIDAFGGLNANGKWEVTRGGETYEREAPLEGYLRKVFPDDTIQYIIDLKTNKTYHSILSLRDLKAKMVSNNLGGTSVESSSPENYQWIPKYAYLNYPQKNESGSPIGEPESFMGITRSKISGEYDDFVKTKYTKEDEVKRYFDRMSYSGKEVPKGMNPNLYDEYLYKKDRILKSENQDNPALLVNKQLAQLDAQYMSPLGEGGVPEFSYGIDPASREAFMKMKAKFDQKYDPQIGALQDRLANMVSYDLSGMPLYDANYDEVSEQLNQLTTKRNQEYELLRTTWGYDYWKPSVLGKAFDEWWDKWGTLVQIVGNIALVVASGGIAGIFRGVAAGAVRALAPTVADVTFNALVGAYQANRGQDSEALISFICAFLPVAKYGFNVGKVSQESAVKLATKIRNTSGLLTDKQSLSNFIALLSEEERYIFRNVMSLPKEEIQKGFDLILKDINAVAAKEGIEIAKTSFKTWGKPFLKELGLEFGVPAAAQIANTLTGFIVDSTPMIEWDAESLDKSRKMVEAHLQSIKGKTDEETKVKQIAVANAVFDDAQLKNDLKNKKTFEEATNTIVESIDDHAREINAKTTEDVKKDIVNDTELAKKVATYNDIFKKNKANPSTNKQTPSQNIDNKE
jgi:hypothetical protein